MRRHKAVARIFLFLTIANFTFAGLAQTPTMNETRFDLVAGGAEGVAEAAPEMGHMTRSEEEEEEPSEMLGRTSRAAHLQSRFDLIPAQSFNTGDLSTDPEDPEGKRFFNKELNRKLKEYLVLGSIAGIFTGVANGIQKQIAGTLSPYATTVGRSVEPLDEFPQDQKDAMSHCLSNVRDEDLQMLSMISRRTLKSLDRMGRSREG